MAQVTYMLFSMGIGLYLSRKNDNAENYLLAGKSMIWQFIVISQFASNESS